MQSSNNLDGKYRITTQVIRWTARIWSIVVVGLLILLIIGEGINPSFTYVWFRLLFIPFGISIEMILVWWWEALGGGIIVGNSLADTLKNYLHPPFPHCNFIN